MMGACMTGSAGLVDGWVGGWMTSSITALHYGADMMECCFLISIHLGATILSVKTEETTGERRAERASGGQSRPACHSWPLKVGDV